MTIFDSLLRNSSNMVTYHSNTTRYRPNFLIIIHATPVSQLRHCSMSEDMSPYFHLVKIRIISSLCRNYFRYHGTAQNVCIDQLLNSVSGVQQKVPRNITNWARFNFNVEKFVCHRFGLRFRLTIRDRRKHPKSVRDFVFHKLRHTVNKRKNYYQYHRYELYTQWDSERQNSVHHTRQMIYILKNLLLICQIKMYIFHDYNCKIDSFTHLR